MGRRQQQARVRRNPGRAARAIPAAARPWIHSEGGPAAEPELHFPALILAPVRTPGKEARAGPPERRRDLNVWDAGRANVLARQPPGASWYTHRFRWPPVAPSCSDVRDADLWAALTVPRAARWQREPPTPEPAR